MDDTYEVGVVVIGGGITGLVAAAERGGKVVLLDKQSALGDSTAMSEGLFAFTGTREQDARRVKDTVDLPRPDLREIGGHRNDITLVDTYGARQLAQYDVCRDRAGRGSVRDPLCAGEVVLSGALGPMFAVTGGDHVHAELSTLGSLEVTSAEQEHPHD